jgi:hypothetical protein
VNRPGRLRHFIESAILAAPRHRLRKASRKKLNAAVRALEQVRETRAKLTKYNMPDVLELYDVSQFCIMYAADLTVLTRDMACHQDWWESRLYARLLAMTMLECAEDLPAVLGKKFRDSLAVVVPDDRHRERLSKITSDLSDFRKRHERELRDIRRIAAAHRDHNPSLVISLIEQLDTQALLSMAGELQELQTEFSLAMTEVFLGINAVREVLKHFSRSRDGI